MSKHEKFILSPMSIILKEAVHSSNGIGTGIETYPLCDYIMQSILLKMTGYQEQKMRFVAWEIATNNFEYRRKLLNNEFKLGEYSTYESKKTIYKSLCKQLKHVYSNYSFIDQNMKIRVKNNSVNLVKDIFTDTNLAIWNYRAFKQFLGNDIIKDTQYLLTSGNLFESLIFEEYEVLYDERNRIAHNTVSYQQNLPDFSKLSGDTPYLKNYFLWFAILLLIDSIFIEIYKIYKETLKLRAY